MFKANSDKCSCLRIFHEKRLYIVPKKKNGRSSKWRYSFLNFLRYLSNLDNFLVDCSRRPFTNNTFTIKIHLFFVFPCARQRTAPISKTRCRASRSMAFPKFEFHQSPAAGWLEFSVFDKDCNNNVTSTHGTASVCLSITTLSEVSSRFADISIYRLPLVMDNGFFFFNIFY